MENERIKVLEMVESGTISADEATKLLETLHATSSYNNRQLEEKFTKFSTDMKDFAKDVSCKVNELYKNAEPRIKDFAKNVVSKTATIADNISTSLHEKIKDMEDWNPLDELEQPIDNGPRPEEDEVLNK